MRNEMDLKIKTDKLEKFKEVAGQNCTDMYSFAALHAAIHTMDLLGDETKTPKEAMDEGFKGKDLTGFLAGCAAQIVSEFAERGDEFRKFWNSRYGISEEKANGGVVNPAIMTIGD